MITVVAVVFMVVIMFILTKISLRLFFNLNVLYFIALLCCLDLSVFFIFCMNANNMVMIRSRFTLFVMSLLLVHVLMFICLMSIIQMYFGPLLLFYLFMSWVRCSIRAFTNEIIVCSRSTSLSTRTYIIIGMIYLLFTLLICIVNNNGRECRDNFLYLILFSIEVFDNCVSFLLLLFLIFFTCRFAWCVL